MSNTSREAAVSYRIIPFFTGFGALKASISRAGKSLWYVRAMGALLRLSIALGSLSLWDFYRAP